MLDAFEVRKYDRSGLYKDYESWPRHAESAFNFPLELEDKGPFSNVVYVGMGGSGTAGDIVADWLNPLWSIPLIVVKDFALPACASDNSLVVLVSYSGETREVLSCFKQAVNRGAKMVAVSSGGSLYKLALRKRIPNVKVDGALTPRSGLAYLLYAALNVLSKVGLPKEARRQIEDSIGMVKRIANEISPKVDESRNISKKLARWLISGLPTVIAPSSYRGVATRFKNSLNENAKLLALTMTIPESCHNDLEAISKSSNIRTRSIFVRDDQEEPGNALAQKILLQIMKDANLKIFELHARGENRLSRLVSTLYTLEYSTLYAAVARRIDPTPTPALKRFRETIRSKLGALMYR